MLFTSPAKLNLMLQITGRRDDGYHLLQTVFQFIDLADEISLQVNRSGVIRRLGENSGIPEEADLLVRAARLLQQVSRSSLGVDIEVEKRIPMGGGLGGGSSNAATCLLALNRLWQLDMPLQQLESLGVQLGADIPVFLRGKAAWAEGVGELLQAVELPEPWYLVLHPGINVPTAQIFTDEQLTRNCDPITIRAFLRGAGSNVCEPVARRLFPQVDQALSWLGERAEARMTGTGACVFAAFDSQPEAEKVKLQVPAGWNAWVSRGLNASPLLRQLEQIN